MDEARKVFDKNPHPIGATALISAFGWRDPLKRDISSALAVFDRLVASHSKPNVQVFGALLRACCASGNRAKALSIFDTMQSLYGVTPDEQCFSILTHACGQAGDAATAKLLAQKMTSGALPFIPRESTCIPLVTVLCKASSPSLTDMISLFEWISRHVHIRSTTLYTMFLNRCAADKDLNAAWQVFDHFLQTKITPNVQVFGALMKACCVCEDRQKALSILDTMQPLHGVIPDEQCFAILSHACGQAGDAATAKMLLQKITSRTLPFVPSGMTCTQLAMALCKSSPPQPGDAMILFDWVIAQPIECTSAFYTVLLNGCATNKDLTTAWRVFDHFLQTNTTPNIHVFGALLKACCACEERTIALSIFDTMQSHHNITPDEPCFATLAHACGQAGDAATAKILLQRMTSGALPFVPSGMTCTQLATALCKSSPPQLEDAVALFNWAITQPIECTSAFYTVLLNGCATNKDLTTAWRVFDHFLQTNTTPNVHVFGALLKTLCESGDRAKALSILDTMQALHGVTPDEPCFATLAHACGQAGDASTAKALLQRMTSGALPFVPSGMTCTQMASALCKSSPPQLEDAVALFNWVIAQPIERTSAFYTVLLNGCATNKDLTTAWQVFDHFLQTNTTPNVHVFGALLKTLCESGDRAKALSIFDTMQSHHNISPDESCFATLAHACGQAGDASTAKALLQRMTSGALPFVPSGMTCTQLATALCKSSPPQLEDAVALFNWAITQPIECTSAFYTVLLNGCARCAGLATGRRLHAHIRTNDKVVWDDLLYSTLVDMYGKCGSLHEAQAAFDEARQNWNKYSQPLQQSVSVWNSMINVYGLHGEARRALQMLKDMEHGEVKPDDVTLVAALNACSHAGLVKEALGLLNSMEKEWGIQPDTRHETCIVDALGRAGRIEEAERFANQMAHPNDITWKTLLGACRGYRR